MSLGNETTKNTLSNQSSNSNNRNNNRYRRRSSDKNKEMQIFIRRQVDEIDQIVKCANCAFIAPISLSFENYIRLHEEYNRLMEKTCNKIYYNDTNIKMYKFIDEQI